MDNHRRSERFPFVATAYVTDQRTGSAITARLGDLSLHGCYIRMSSPLTAGTKVTIHLGAGTNVFQAIGTVIHSQPNDGFGVEFDRQHIEPSSFAVLEAWLTEARMLYTSEGVE